MNICRGASPRPIEKYITMQSNGINWIKIGDISPKENVIKTTKEKITEEGAKHSRYVRKGDLILSNSMSFGRPYILEIDGCIHDGWLLIQDLEKLFDKKYLCYLLDSDTVKHQYRKYAAGGVVINLNSELVRSVSVFIPKVQEQEKIASFLTLIDKKIEKQKELVELLKKYKRGLLSQIFSQKLRFKDDNGNWKKIKLDKIGYFLGGGTPSKNKLEYWNGNIPWVSSSDISENSIDNINISRFITKNAVNNSSTKICPNGTICIVSRVGVGKLAISKQCVCTSQDFVNFINTTNNNNYYIAYYLKEIMKRKVLKTQGTSIKGITSLEIKNIQISLPKIEIQNKIASLLKYNDYLINANESFIKFLIQYKKGLLQQLFI